MVNCHEAVHSNKVNHDWTSCRWSLYKIASECSDFFLHTTFTMLTHCIPRLVMMSPFTGQRTDKKAIKTGPLLVGPCARIQSNARRAAFSKSPAEHFLYTPDTYLFCASDGRASTHIDTHSILDRPENRKCVGDDRAFSFVSSRSLQLISQPFRVSSLSRQVVGSTSLTRRTSAQSYTDAV